MPELPKAYQPTETEPEIYKRWEASGYFNPDKLPNAKRRKPFVISMPPPNITGELHFGHALGMTIEDVLIRYQRMAGRAALWLPGTDHAAISTQVVVERELRQQGIDRRKLGREKFLKKVWEWKEKYGRRIVEQIKALGASADWSRERFTMDPELSTAVQAAFVKLYRDGFIYRGERIINWCSDCQTAISDLEVDHQDTPGKLWFIKYPLADGPGSITVATTRPETMLGDTAVAVNPKDGRYARFVGQRVRLPIVHREIPIVADARIDQAFGTGAVKVTPAHDPLDFDLGHDHRLERIQVIGFDGQMAGAAGPDFSGLSIGQARRKIVERLRAEGIVEKEDDYIHAVGYCQRSKTPIEPLVSRQWFMRMEELAKPAIAAVRKGQITILPKRFEKVYFRWMENIRDWNISRQIWWGHRLPVWYDQSDPKHEHPRVSVAPPGISWIQDDDTLDTWFSSGLWTFSTLGWPKKTKDLQRFHPTAVMETGWDILFFWVARMIMFSLYFREEVPFKTVYLHGLILDEDGKKMSKSKGTGIDPLPTAEKYGLDAVRMSLIVGNAPGQDFRVYDKKIEGFRNFANKLWNVARFSLAPGGSENSARPPPADSAADRWIRYRLNQVVTATTAALERNDLSAAGQGLYDFVWHELADWYLEANKVQPNAAVLIQVVETSLRLLHPFMPFVTERLWQEFRPGELLMIAAWPKPNKAWARYRPEARRFALFQQTVVAVRNFKAHSRLPAEATGAFVDDLDAGLLQALSGVSVRATRRLEVVGGSQDIVLGPTRFQFPSEHVKRYAAWRQQERQRLERYRDSLQQKLNHPQFVERAPREIVEHERQKLAESERRLLEL